MIRGQLFEIELLAYLAARVILRCCFPDVSVM